LNLGFSRCLFPRMFFREVMADDTTAHGTRNGVMAGIVPRYCAYGRAFEAAGRRGGTCFEGQCEG
jgi:hypothetical protein